MHATEAYEALYGEVERVLGDRMVATVNGVTAEMVMPDDEAFERLVVIARAFARIHHISQEAIAGGARLLESQRLGMDTHVTWQQLRPENDGVEIIHDLLLHRQVMTVVIRLLHRLLIEEEPSARTYAPHRRWK